MAAAMYKLKDKVLGVKEPSIDAMPIEDPETGILLTDPEEINEVTLKYCLDNLKDREPKEEFKNIHQNKLHLHTLRMNESIENDMEELNHSQFEDALKTVAKKHKDKYQFILKAGKSLLDALFRLYQLVWKSENIPEG